MNSFVFPIQKQKKNKKKKQQQQNRLTPEIFGKRENLLAIAICLEFRLIWTNCDNGRTAVYID